MKGYDEVEITYTLSISNKKEKAAMQKLMNARGNCCTIMCEDCLFSKCESACGMEREMVKILKLLGFKREE